MTSITSAAPRLAAGIAFLLLPALARAQQPTIAFDQLHRWLKPGDTVWLTDAQGRETKGHVRDIQPSSLTLDARGTKTFKADDVRVLKERGHRSMRKWILWGTVAGTAAGVPWALAVRGEKMTGCWPGLPPDAVCSPWYTGAGEEAYGLIAAGAGIGAAAGAIVGALLPGGANVIYRAPGACGSARLSIAPVFTPHTKGVAVAYSF